jgi:hypothetical protein
LFLIVLLPIVDLESYDLEDVAYQHCLNLLIER